MSDLPAPLPRHSAVTRLFHWVTVVLVAVMYGAGIAMTSEGFLGARNTLFILHKGLGTVILVFVVLRIVWRSIEPPTPPPEGLSPTHLRLMGATHALLYGLLLTLTVSGYVRVVGGGFPIEWMDRLGIPTLLPRMPVWAPRMSVLHKFAGYLFAGVIAAHIAAAVHHGIQRREGVLHRIWPPLGRGR
jgi:cytochrome b561